MDELDALRSHLVTMLQGGHAFDTFDEIVGSFRPDKRGLAPAGAERSPWQILSHIVIAQRDILDFSRNQNGDYIEKRWPQDYWPASPEPPSNEAWDNAAAQFHADREAMEELIAADESDLFGAFPWGDGQTLLREALLVAEHNAYHLGQLVTLRELV